VILANIIRMYHLGQVVPVAIIGGGAGTIRARAMLWDLTVHSREHSQIQPGCWACKLRDRYSCLNEALYE